MRPSFLEIKNTFMAGHHPLNKSVGNPPLRIPPGVVDSATKIPVTEPAARPQAEATHIGMVDHPTPTTSRLPTHPSSDSEKIKVVVRIRPFAQFERPPARPVISMQDDKTVVVWDIDHETRTESIEFKVHYVQDDSSMQTKSSEAQNDSQQHMFEVLGIPCVEHTLNGLDSTILAYGHTGSGKTYTMMGDGTFPGRGIMPRLGSELMNRIAAKREKGASITVHVSYFEIYQERIRDLLDQSMKSRNLGTDSGNASEDEIEEESSTHSASPGDEGNAPETPRVELHSDPLNQKTRKKPRQWRQYQPQSQNLDDEQNFLKVREHPVTGPYVEGLLWKEVGSWKEIKRWLKHGAAYRTTHSTDANLHSSRSHALFTIRVSQKEEGLHQKLFESPIYDTSCIHLVDLAGSERQSDLQSAEAARGEESRAINLSLTILNEVILSLSRNAYPSYRSSVLTWLLRDSFGGNNKTFMVANISPTEHDLRESVSTLRYAAKANTIESGAFGADQDPRNALIYKLKEELGVLRNLAASRFSAEALHAAEALGFQFGATSPAGHQDIGTQTPKIIFTPTDMQHESSYGHCELHSAGTNTTSTDCTATSEGQQLSSVGLRSIPRPNSRILEHVGGIEGKRMNMREFVTVREHGLHQATSSRGCALEEDPKVQRIEGCSCTGSQFQDSEASKLASTICSIWAIVKLTKQTPCSLIEMKGHNESEGSKPASLVLRRLWYSGVEPITFESSTPFFIQVLGENYLMTASLRYRSPKGFCKIMFQKSGSWRAYFLKAGLNTFGSPQDVHCRIEGCSKDQAVFIHMPADRSVDQKGYVVVQILCKARAELNGEPILHPEELVTGDKLVLHTQPTTCTLYFFDPRNLPKGDAPLDYSN